MKTPIYDFVSDYISKNGARLHMPGHKGRIFLGAESHDITEICGADSLFEADGIEYKEVIARGALDSCDMSDFIFNRNHGQNDSTVYARTRNNSLTYNITERGLDIAAFLDKEDERHRNLHRDIQKRRVDKMSFSFVVRECSYDRETHTRTITKIKKLYDVSAVDFAAYNETSITTARDFFSAEHEKEFKEQEQRRRRQMLTAKTYC